MQPQPKAPTQNSAPAAARAQKREQPQHVEAVFAAEEMFLRDPQTDRVYSATRDRKGRLVAVGRWQADAQLIKFEAQPAKRRAQPSLAPLAAEQATADAPLPRRRPELPEALAFDCDPEDHCETSAAAYADVKPLLNFLCRQLDKRPKDLRIYDPYYCAGSAEWHLAEMGFTNVYNKYTLHSMHTLSVRVWPLPFGLFARIVCFSRSHRR